MMKAREYATKARKSLNYWAENHLPGGKMWSDDMSETYRIFRAAEPRKAYTFAVLAAAGNLGASLSINFIYQDVRSAALAVLTAGTAIVTWKLVHYYKELYDELDDLVKRTRIIHLDSVEPLYDRIKEVWIRDHGLEKYYKEAKFAAETIGRTPMRG